MINNNVNYCISKESHDLAGCIVKTRLTSYNFIAVSNATLFVVRFMSIFNQM